MKAPETAEALWSRLNATKSSVITRAERYAELTVRKLLLADGRNKEAEGLAHDYQSLGAQAVNHLTNKLMLAMFRPSAPFFRLQAARKARQSIDPATLAALQPQLSNVEREAMRELDGKAQRPKLYAIMRHLIVIGNVLMLRSKDTLRVMSLKYYCVKRTLDGRVHTLITCENISFDELAFDVQAAAAAANAHKEGEDKVNYYQVVRLQADGGYITEQWVNSLHLDPAKFDGKYTAETLPFHALTWDLADEHDYGTSLVEDSHGDFEALSALAESVVDGSVIGTELRWLIDPTATLTAKDVNESKNGDALPGRKDDMVPMNGGNPQAVQQALSGMQAWEQRLARSFLLLSAVTRDAERVTAEEVRLTALELETALGGVYSSLSAQIQAPIARWLLDAIDMSIDGADIELQVITGLDALSRSGDLEALRLALGDLAAISQLPESLQGRINFQAIAGYIGAGRGIDLLPFLKSEAQYQQEQTELRAAQVAQETATAAGQAAAQGMQA